MTCPQRPESRHLHAVVARVDQSIDEVVGEWRDRQAVVVYDHDELVGCIPLLVRWVLPYLASTRLRDLSREDLIVYRDAVAANGASIEIIQAGLEIIDEVLGCAANWGHIVQSPISQGTVRLRLGLDTADVIPFPSRTPPDGTPESPDP